MRRRLTIATLTRMALLAGSFAVSSNMTRAVRADEPLEAVVVGSPEKIDAFPSAIKLVGPRSKMQLVVTGSYADGQVQDLTRAAQFAVTDPAVIAIENAVVRPRGDGRAEITVTVGGKTVQATVEVGGYATVQPISFEYDLLAALSKQGCNMGACHGSPNGKGGFRLSLRAFDPAMDKLTLMREHVGRRTNVIEPDESLILVKPLMKTPHGGGKMLARRDPAYTIIREWIAQGCQGDKDGSPRCIRLEVYPPSGRLLKRPAYTQQLCVHAHFSDGSVRDVTELACYSTSDPLVCDVTASGLVIGRNRGEAAIVVRYLEFIESCFITFVEDVPDFAWNNPPSNNYIDELVHARLKQLQYLPSATCNDEQFLRRVYLDVIGTLPSVEESRSYLADSAADKRAKLIDALLDRPDHARFWALKWGDLLKMTSGQIGRSGVFKYHAWLERSFKTNMPYDQFARDLIGAQGSTLENPAANFYRTATDTYDCVETVSQVFLGSRLQCAKCHNHPFERWTQDNYFGMGAFFTRVARTKTPLPDEYMVFSTQAGEVTQPRTKKQMRPWLPVVGEIQPEPDADRRIAFLEWLTAKHNPFFAKVEANRIWSQLFGRGIVEPFDDFRESNPPANAVLLDALAKDFAENGFDRRRLLRTILNSRTYQADSRANEFNKDDMKYCSHRDPRLLSAEQLLDAVCSVTDLPEHFAGLPAGTKSTQLPAPDLAQHEFLKVFGRPERQTVCQCERTTESNFGMAAQFYGGPLVSGKLRNANNRFRKLLAAGKPHEEIVADLYLAAFCRLPTEPELQANLSYIKNNGDPIIALEDICWAILNTNEFLFQH